MRLTLLALPCVLMASTGAYAQNAPFDAAAAIKSFLTDTANFGAESATVGSVATSGATVTAEDVAIEWKTTIEVPDSTLVIDASLTIPTLTVEGLVATGEGHSVEALVVPKGTLSIKASGGQEPLDYTLEVTDYTLTAGAWGPWPQIAADPSKPVSRFGPLIDWEVNQSYQQRGVGGVSGTFTVGDDTQQLEYGAGSVGPYENGRYEALEFGPISMSQDVETLSATGEPQTITLDFDYGKIAASGIDLRPLAQLLTGTGDATGPTTMLGHLEFAGLTAKGSDGISISSGPIVSEDATVDPTRGPLLAKLDPIVASAIAGEEPNPQDLMGLALDYYGAFGQRSTILKDLAMSGPDFDFKLGTSVLEDLSAAGLGRFSLDGLSLESPQAGFSLGGFEVSGVTFPAREVVVELLMRAIAGTPPSPDNLAALPTLGGLSIRNLFARSGPEGSPAVQLGRFDLGLGDYINGIPTRVGMTLEDLSLPVDFIRDPMTVMMLQSVGADPVRADGTLTLEWNEEGGDVTLDEDLHVESVGRLATSAALSGIPRVVFENPARANEAIATAAVNGLTIRFDDGGMTPFLIGMMSEQAGISAEDFAKGISQQVGMQVGSITGSTELANEISSTLEAYLTDPGNLTITAAPPAAVPLAQIIGAAMAAPQQIQQLLNISISANQ